MKLRIHHQHLQAAAVILVEKEPLMHFFEREWKRTGPIQTDRQTVSMDDVFMVPLLKHPPDRSRFTAGAGTVSPLSGPQRTRWLPY